MAGNKRELEPGGLTAGKKIPRHVAIIMDGNGRWAKKRYLPRIAGHRAGMKTMRKIVEFANEIGVGILSLYAFSTENWKRPPREVDFLMRLPEEYLQRELPLLIEKNIVVSIMGEPAGLPARTQKAIDTALEKTRGNTGMILNFAFNYGGRTEIIHAVKTLCSEIVYGHLHVDEITEDMFGKYLYSGGMPDPDLLIRPSGELRISNFLLWQLAYTELWFTDVLWPDFEKEHFWEAVLEYQQRERRFGGVSKF
ncbi:MAG: isoprenyl transferase [Dethiobacteria bacterium]